MILAQMSVHGDDISWQVLRRIVHDWIGTSAELAEVKPLDGGSINTTVSLTTNGGDRAVLKISPHRVDRSYVHEAYQLNVLRSIGLPTPQVYSCKVGTLDEPFSYLLMEFIEGIDLGEARAGCDPASYDHLQMHLADLVRMLHGQTHSHYARLIDGERQEFSDWPQFYRNIYDAIWHEAEKSAALSSKVRKQIGRIHERLDRFIAHADVPRLIHSDLWASNVLATQDGHGKWWVGAILDPNCKYAHAEAEVAYLELFKTVNPAFLRAYQSAHRLPPEYHELRKPVYQMYELLNHLQLFGAEYLKPLLGVMEKVGRFV
jgi:fructosamine-3-kinase